MFFVEKKHAGKDGRAYLVGLSQFHLDLYNPQHEMSPVTAKYHMNYANLVSKLKCKMRSGVMMAPRFLNFFANGILFFHC